MTDNIREASNKAGKNKKPAAIIQAMIKKAKDNRWEAAQAIPEGFAFLDGYRMFTVNDSLGYEIVYHDKENENGRRGFDCYSILKSCRAAEYTPIEIDTADLKTFIKLNKETKYVKTPYIFKTPEGYAGINPRFLLDLIEFSGSNTILYNKKNAPIMNTEKTALVLPVNLKSYKGA